MRHAGGVQEVAQLRVDFEIHTEYPELCGKDWGPPLDKAL